MKKLELYPYTMEIIKNNTLFESLERNNSKASAINFMSHRIIIS